MTLPKWYNVTSSASEWIIPAQKWLFDKYAPEFEVEYLNVKDNPIENWGKKVASMIPNDQEFVVFGLDDYLPNNKIELHDFYDALLIMKSEKSLDRFELSWGASKKQGFIKTKGVWYDYLKYGEETPYSVSCQFSIWRTKSLIEVLNRSTTPWDFEVKQRCNAACFDFPVFRYIEESAISKRQPNKVNVLGLRPSDLKSLQSLGYLGNNIIFGWKGATELPEDKGGSKYSFVYDDNKG